jgi:AcrR family transcriptional regulator
MITFIEKSNSINPEGKYAQFRFLSGSERFCMKEKLNQKEHIIITAFDVWNKSNFYTTSLSDLAHSLGMTKPALYRHFKNKDELLESMETWFFEQLISMHNNLTAKMDAAPEEDYIELFISDYYTFFKTYPGLFIYFIRLILEKRLDSNPEVSRIGRELSSRFAVFLERSSIKTSDASQFFLYSTLTVFFWLFPFFIAEKKEWGDILRINPKNSEEYLGIIASICKNGVSVSRCCGEIDYSFIEEKANVSKTELPLKERIMDVVEEVVSQAGLTDASIDRIASALGMKKSSLYFYFENKDDMLLRMIRHMEEHILALVEKKVLPFKTFAERSYAFMVCMTSQILSRRSMLPMFNWLRFQNLKINLPPPKPEYIRKYFSFVGEAFEKKELAQHVHNPMRVGSFLLVLTVQEIFFAEQNRIPEESIFSRLRILHRLFLNGLMGTTESPVKL